MPEAFPLQCHIPGRPDESPCQKPDSLYVSSPFTAMFLQFSRVAVWNLLGVQAAKNGQSGCQRGLSAASRAMQAVLGSWEVPV